MTVQVNVHGAAVTVRTVNLSKALLKQCRIFKQAPEPPFTLPRVLTPEKAARLTEIRAIPKGTPVPEEVRNEFRRLEKEERYLPYVANPELAVGWFSGTVLGEEHSNYVLFAQDGDLYLWKVFQLGFRRAVDGLKQIYI